MAGESSRKSKKRSMAHGCPEKIVEPKKTMLRTDSDAAACNIRRKLLVAETERDVAFQRIKDANKTINEANEKIDRMTEKTLKDSQRITDLQQRVKTSQRESRNFDRLFRNERKMNEWLSTTIHQFQAVLEMFVSENTILKEDFMDTLRIHNDERSELIEDLRNERHEHFKLQNRLDIYSKNLDLLDTTKSNIIKVLNNACYELFEVKNSLRCFEEHASACNHDSDSREECMEIVQQNET